MFYPIINIIWRHFKSSWLESPSAHTIHYIPVIVFFSLNLKIELRSQGSRHWLATLLNLTLFQRKTSIGFSFQWEGNSEWRDKWEEKTSFWNSSPSSPFHCQKETRQSKLCEFNIKLIQKRENWKTRGGKCFFLKFYVKDFWWQIYKS